MLSDDEILALREYALRLTDPVNQFIIRDLAERIAAAGKLAETYGKVTATAKYRILLAETLGVQFKDIRKEIKKRLNLSEKQIAEMFKLAAETSYIKQAENFGVSYLDFADNPSLQQIVKASVDLATEDFRNITQTLGMVDRSGNEMPLKRYYNSIMDDVFNRVSTGASDYNSAVRDACNALAERGVTSIGYQSGVKTSLEAAVRRNIMGGLGLMVEKVGQYNHETFGANGWEMSAHAMSAPDHEPYQGRQYTDAEWIELNGAPPLPGASANQPQKQGKLKRRVGTLNCGHNAFSIIIGVNEPQYTPERLQKFKDDNKKGVTYEDKHYTMYEATQEMRRIERVIRKWKRRKIAAKASKDNEALAKAESRLTVARRAYREFADAAGLRTQEDRLFVSNGQFRKRVA